MGKAVSGALSGGASGAAAGSVFGPWGTAIGGGLGALIGGISGASSDDAAEEKLRMLEKLAMAYQAARPEFAQSRVNAMNQTMGAFKPLNAAIGANAGRGAMMDLDAIARNPLTPGTLDPGVGPVHDLQRKVVAGNGR